MPNTLVELWQCNAAGRYLHAARRSSGAARSELQRRGPDDDRRRRPLPVRDDQAGRLSVAESPQRLASGAHSLFAVRHLVPVAARDADVLPERSAVPARSDLQLGSRRARAAADGVALRSRSHRAGVGARLSLRHRPARPGVDAVRSSAHERPGTPDRDLVADGRSVLPLRPDDQRALGRSGAGPDAPGDHIQLRICVLDGAGAPVPDALVELYQADADGRYQPGVRGERGVHGVRPSADRRRGMLSLPHHQAGRGPHRSCRPGAARQRVPAVARPAAADLHAHLFHRRSGAGDRSDPRARARRSAADPPRRAVGERAGPSWEFVIRLQGDDETVFFDL